MFSVSVGVALDTARIHRIVPAQWAGRIIITGAIALSRRQIMMLMTRSGKDAKDC
jgi:hypothetical protein